MPPQPTALTLQPDGKLVIAWSDGRRRRYDPGELRQKCPCATCLHERSLPENAATPEKSAAAALTQVHPVGNYAYNIQFGDGHATGIFSLEMLLELGEEI
jgi:DUF971 family protein